ncbi:MAG: hypothetical protein AAFU79_14395 [Myxococcota bacterium]
MRTTAFALLPLAWALNSSCLDDPVEAVCGDFPLDGTPECPDPCVTYCEEVTFFCPETFDSFDDCRRACEPEPTAGAVVPNGNFGDTSGNTLSCRITAAQDLRCEDAGLSGSEACGCSQYCEDVLAACPGTYPNEENCLASCTLLPLGRPGVPENSVLCREQAAAGARLEPNNPNLCNTASFGGGGRCGQDVCDLFCSLHELHCTEGNRAYADADECQALCQLMNVNGNFDDWQFDTELDSVQCRLYHAGPPAALDPQIHCPHTAVYNIEHCGVTPMAVQPDNWPCQTFCDITQRNCPGVYPSRAACFADCSTFPEIRDLALTEQPNIYPISSLACPTR